MYTKLQQVSSIGIAVLIACVVAGAIGTAIWERPWPASPGRWWASTSCSPSRWLRSGKRWRCCALADTAACADPGIFAIIPVVDTLSRFVDQRVRVTKVTAETALTATRCR